MSEEQSKGTGATIVGAVVFRAVWFLVWFALPFVAYNRSIG